MPKPFRNVTGHFLLYLIPEDYTNQIKKACLLLYIGTNILSDVLAYKMPYRYSANPAYFNSNNYWLQK